LLRVRRLRAKNHCCAERCLEEAEGHQLKAVDSIQSPSSPQQAASCILAGASGGRRGSGARIGLGGAGRRSSCCLQQKLCRARGRLELARGYFVLGELVREREEFETVLRKGPPPAVQATVERFMASIRAQETRYAATATGYIEIGGGYDSNVNSGIGNPVISVPTLGTVQLAQAGVKSGSSFLHLGAGGSMSHPVAPGVALLGGANAEFKLNAGSF